MLCINNMLRAYWHLFKPKISWAALEMPHQRFTWWCRWRWERGWVQSGSAGPAQEQVQDLHKWAELGWMSPLKAQRRAQVPAGAGTRRRGAQGHKGGTDEQRSQLGPLLNFFSTQCYWESYQATWYQCLPPTDLSGENITIWHLWRKQRQSKALLSSFISWRIWLWVDKGPRPAKHVGKTTLLLFHYQDPFGAKAPAHTHSSQIHQTTKP